MQSEVRIFTHYERSVAEGNIQQKQTNRYETAFSIDRTKNGRINTQKNSAPNERKSSKYCSAARLKTVLCFISLAVAENNNMPVNIRQFSLNEQKYGWRKRQAATTKHHKYELIYLPSVGRRSEPYNEINVSSTWASLLLQYIYIYM